MTRLLDEQLTYSQHGEVLGLAGRLALLVGCTEYDVGLRVNAETTRQFALELGTELDDRDLMGWRTRCQPGSPSPQATTTRPSLQAGTESRSQDHAE